MTVVYALRHQTNICSEQVGKLLGVSFANGSRTCSELARVKLDLLAPGAVFRSGCRTDGAIETSCFAKTISVRRPLLSSCWQNQARYTFGGVGLQRCSYVGVDIGGDAFAGVVEPVLDNLHRHTSFEGQGCPAMTQRVETDLRQLRIGMLAVVTALGSFELAAETFRMEIVAVGSSEDKIPEVEPVHLTTGFGRSAFVTGAVGESFLMLE